jgi:predicted small metal-binding protein
MTTNEKGKYTFRCGDVMQGCDWQASANSKDELLSKVVQHGKEQHHITSIDPETMKKVEGVIERQAA